VPDQDIALTKTVLLIAYEFPPAGGPGVQRCLKFVKYLPEFGWQSVVVTATPKAYSVLDGSLCDDIPAGTPVYRVKSPDVNRLRPAFERVRLEKLISAINTGLMFPDAALPWAYLGRAAVRHVVEQHRPDVICSSSPPASTHMLGQWAHKTFGLPWITDFRDPWSADPLYPYYPGYRTLNRWLERGVLSNAMRIVTVSEPLVEMFRHLSGDPSKVVQIGNGYDEPDVEVLPAPQTSRFTITYTGGFSRLRPPNAFVSAVDQLITENLIPADDIRVVFAGKDTDRYIPCRPPFEHLGYLGHLELNALRRNSDLLLLIHGDTPESRWNYGGKLYEYMGCNRPTLVVARPDNVAAQLVERAGAGVAVSHNPSDIAAALLHYYHKWRSRDFTYTPDWDLIHQHTRRSLTQRLAEELNRASYSH
jgi:hypothetical protein